LPTSRFSFYFHVCLQCIPIRNLDFTLCGALLFFLQDSSDAMLEMAKIGMYMRRRTNGTYYKYIDFARSVIFVLFAANSILCRLYWYPCKLLYGTSYGAVYLGPQIAAFFPVLGVMLVLIYALNLYWFNVSPTRFLPLNLLFILLFMNHCCVKLDISQEKKTHLKSN
uniref:TLC domain-containing protein n=1 Tax=Heligmosomoides polygyrus TaxID=6339 RepID=A0A183FS06_HELPZ